MELIQYRNAQYTIGSGSDFGQYRNAVASLATSQDWASVASGIASKSGSELTQLKAYIVERFGCSSSLGMDTTNYVIDKLTIEKNKNSNLIEKSRINGVIKALVADRDQCSSGGGLVNTNPNCQRDSSGNCVGVPSGQSSWDAIISQLGHILPIGSGSSFDQTVTVDTGTQTQPVKSSKIWWIVGGVAFVGVASVVVWSLLRTKKK